MTSWPGAFTTIDGKALKVLTARVESEADRAGARPGTVVMAGRDIVIVSCGAGTIQIVRAQAEGRKPLAAAELVAGRTLQTGMVLGR